MRGQHHQLSLLKTQSNSEIHVAMHIYLLYSAGNSTNIDAKDSL